MLLSLRSLALGGLALASSAYASSSLFAGTVVSCPVTNSTPLSCHSTGTQSNTCCFNEPGGLLLQTQFWDTNPPSGPANSWTAHGLWPDNCDGTYQSFCDPNRQYTNITAILKSFGATNLLNYMNTFWTSNTGTAESFWEHEWAKHGTCISSFDTKCYNNYAPTQEVVDFMNKTVTLFKALDSYSFLAAAGITPSSSATYSQAAITAALKRGHGATPVIRCQKTNQLDEVWYFFNTRGSAQTGVFVPTAPSGSSSNCPSTGIKYLPKGGGAKRLRKARSPSMNAGAFEKRYESYA